jgi:hypothetical protein
MVTDGGGGKLVFPEQKSDSKDLYEFGESEDIS